MSVGHLGLIALFVLTLQNSFKSIFMRFIMKDQPEFLLSTAIVTVEVLKLVLCLLYIQFVEMKPLESIGAFLRQEHRSSKLLTVPASCYILQMSMEYVAFSHLEANVFIVIVQTKMLFTAFFFVLVLNKKLAKKQVFSLVLLTVGVMLCSMKPQNSLANNTSNSHSSANTTKGILATLTIAMSSGFASCYTEKVIKANASSSPPASSMESNKKDLDVVESSSPKSSDKDVEMAPFLKNHTTVSSSSIDHNNNIPTSSSSSSSSTPLPMKYSLAYTQVQLALVSLIILGIYVIMVDHTTILEKGFFYNFDTWAFLSCVNSAVGGLIVAAVLKYADSVLKNYSTAVSVLVTGIASYLIFGTELPVLYWMGLINVTCSIFLYNATGLDEPLF